MFITVIALLNQLQSYTTATDIPWQTVQSSDTFQHELLTPQEASVPPWAKDMWHPFTADTQVTDRQRKRDGEKWVWERERDGHWPCF